MTPRWYTIIERAVCEGALYGVNRAYKHNDSPTREDIADAVSEAVMAAIGEVISFENEAGDCDD